MTYQDEISEALKESRKKKVEENGETDLTNYYGYLEGVRDFLEASKKRWERGEFRNDPLHDGRNIPFGYDDEGNRI